MTYSGRTTNYRIPYMFLGDIIDPDEEQAVFSTIDNQLYGIARMHSGGNGIIRTGSFSIASDGAGGYDVTLVDVSGNTAFEAFINQIYVASTDAVVWEGLSNNTTYYLYAQLVEVTEADGSSRRDMAFALSMSTVNDIPGDGVLIASVSVNEPGATTFDTAPVGRIDIPTLLDHMQDYTDPHGTTLIQTNLTVTNLIVDGASTFSGTSSLAGNVYLNSGLTVDGVDPTALVPLLGGGNVDSLHTHDLAALIPLTRQISRTPQYADALDSGVYDGVLEELRDGSRNIYRWTGLTSPATKRLVVQQYVPTDMFNLDTLRVTSKVDNPATENITLTVLDTAGNAVPLTGGVLADAGYTVTDITASGGQFTVGQSFVVNVDMLATSGLATYLGDLILMYNTSGVS